MSDHSKEPGAWPGGGDASPFAPPPPAVASRGESATAPAIQPGPRTRCRVVVADDDALMRQMLAKVVESAGHLAIECAGGREVLRVADEGGEAPSIFLLDWMMPDLDGIEVCRLLRARKGSASAYVILVTGRTRSADVVEGLSAGADDFVTKPFDPAELAARLRVGERVLGQLRPPQHPLVEVLAEAARGRSGEVVARSGEVVARVHLHEGSVVWAHLSNETGAVLELLEDAKGLRIDRRQVREVIEECRRSGRHFPEALVERGIIERAGLRERMRSWLRRRMERIFQLQSPSVLFVPEARRFSSDLSFPLEEVLPAAVALHGATLPIGTALPAARPPAAVSPPVPLPPPVPATGVLDELLGIEGVRGAVLFDVETGTPLVVVGDRIESDTLWSKVRYISSLQACGAGNVESLLVNTELEHHLIAATSHPSWFLVLVMRKAPSMVAAARAVLQAVARRL